MDNFKYLYPLMLLVLICCESGEEEEIDCHVSDLSASLEATTAGCNDSNGTITVNATGGNGNFTYELGSGTQTPITQNQFTGLAPGAYTVTVSDEEGCTTTASVEITSGISLSSDIMPIIEANCTVSSCHQFLGPPLETEEDVTNNAVEIKASIESGSMPPETEPDLSDEEINLCWVDDGASDD